MNSTLQWTPRKLVAALIAAGMIGGAGVVALEHAHTPVHAQGVAVAQVAQAAPAAPAALGGHAQLQRHHGQVRPGGGEHQRQRHAQGVDERQRRRRRRCGAAQPAPGIETAQLSAPLPTDERELLFGVPSLRTEGMGSGVIIDAEGHVVTNNHVIDQAAQITVKMSDGSKIRDVKVVGRDPLTDLALLKMEGGPFLPAPWGDSSTLEVGDAVLAVGNPFGLDRTVTAGIVSATGRRAQISPLAHQDFLQTDAAINPGNSGGPLVNLRGEVVGINSQIYSRSGGYQGVSFAIPIEVALHVKDEIVAHGKVDHAKLGVAVQEVNQSFADSFKLPKPEGALVSTVEKNGPADKAGLKPGDVITQVNGQPIVASGDLPALIGMAKPGERVTIDIWRQGKPDQLTARLGSLSEKGTQVADAAGPHKGKLGLALRPLQPDEKSEAKVDGGLLVEQASGAAARAGVQQGDVIVSVNGQPVKDIAQVRSIVAKADKSVALLIQRDGERIFVPVNVG